MPSLNTGNAILSNAIAVNSSYNVGIGGAASGSFKLQVTGTSNLTGALTGTSAALTSTLSAMATNIQFNLDGTFGANYYTMGFGGVSNGFNRIAGGTGTTDGLYITSATGRDIAFRTNGGGLTNMLINSVGNVGIGTSSPGAILDINIPNVVNTDLLRFSNSVGGSGDIAKFQYGASGQFVLNLLTNASANRNFGIINGNVGIGTSSPFAIADKNLTINGTSSAVQLGISDVRHAQFYADGAEVRLYAVTNVPLRFGTNDTERMRITSGGFVLINSTTVAPGYKLKVEHAGSGGIMAAASGTGDANFLSTSSSIGYHYYADNGTSARFYVLSNGDVRNTNNSYGAISDISLKENITDATPKLDDLLKVKIRNYNLIDDEAKTKQIGVIAQELEQIFPNMISNDKVMGTDETIKTVKYSVFVPMLIKAIQELTQKVEKQQQTINSLINR
jgi:hypothetical protein